MKLYDYATQPDKLSIRDTVFLSPDGREHWKSHDCTTNEQFAMLNGGRSERPEHLSEDNLRMLCLFVHYATE